MKFSKEIKIGVLVTAAIAVLIWGLNYLKGHNFFYPKNEYYAVYQQIDGLVEANPVQVNGFHVGQVDDVFFHPDNSGNVVVKFIIDKDAIILPRDTKARIFSSDLLGSKAVELILGVDTVFLQSGDTLFPDMEEKLKDAVNRQIRPLKEKAEELIASMDSAVTIVQMVLNKDARENLSKGFESIKSALENFEKTSINLNDLIADNKQRLTDIFISIESISSNIKNSKEELSNAINNFSAISDSLAKADLISTINNANKAMLHASSVFEKIDKGEGTIGLLVNNDSLYNDLERAASNLDMLVEDIRLNPKRYAHFSVFGRKQKQYNKPPSDNKK
ncbi:MAG: MlaD family protein [Bacteroidota bacterium]